MHAIVTNFKYTRITIIKWQLWPSSSTHASVMAAYTEMMNAQLNIHDDLMFTENCLTLNIVKLKTPLCFPRLQQLLKKQNMVNSHPHMKTLIHTFTHSSLIHARLAMFAKGKNAMYITFKFQLRQKYHNSTFIQLWHQTKSNQNITMPFPSSFDLTKD